MKQKVIRKSIDLKKLHLKELPDLSDVRVEGSFWCDFNQLKTLQGAPEYVGGGFECSYNQLTSLEGAPKYVDWLFSCYNNPLKSLKGLPEYVGNALYIPRHLEEKYREQDIRKMSVIKGSVFFI